MEAVMDKEIIVTSEFLKEKKACPEAIVEFEGQSEKSLIPLLRIMVEKEKTNWANWLIVRFMSDHQYLSYAIFSSEQVIDIYEKKYPDDKRPREAIEKAKICLKSPSKSNKKVAAAYAAAAYAAAYAAAAYAAYAAAAYAAYAAREEMRIKILNYGISLLEKDEAERYRKGL